jgi:uncharacterized SAM-binding protein YcdF (DUF218 family)
MASRQEEKEARKRARIEQEERERKATARKKRMQLLLGGVLGLGVIAAIAVVLLTGGSHKAGEGDARAASDNLPALPAQQETDIEKAAKAAGCDLQHPADEGRGHEDKTFTASDYKTNPPTSGAHFPQWAQDGIYDPGNEPQLGELVHTLEHGRIDVQYAPGTTRQNRRKLEAFIADNGGYHMLLFQNPTKMPYQVAATAWDQLLGCKSINDKTWDALRTFRDRYIDQGPEKVA